MILCCLLMAALVMLPACGGDDPAAPPPPPTNPTQEFTASVVLPQGCAIPPESLVVCNGLGNAPVGAEGNFTLTVRRDEEHIAWVKGPGGHPVLAGWFSDESSTLDCRTTAEALVYFALGTWTLPGDGQLQVQAMLRSLTTELDALEADLAAELAASPDGFSSFSQS